MIAADAWLHNVFRYDMPLEKLEKRFNEFNIPQNEFIKKELLSNMIPDAEKRGWKDCVEHYKEIVKLLECIIKEKQKAGDVSLMNN